jgi:CBS domain containing-hemolysin-like protein
MPANEVLEIFIQKKRSMAVVVDEYGGTAGIITMEDIVEEIFGEIEDEHDKEETQEELEIQVDDKNYEFSARLEIDYLNDKYPFELPVNDEQYDTLGGLLLHYYEDIPDEGAVIVVENFTFTVSKVSETRIEAVKISIS